MTAPTASVRFPSADPTGDLFTLTRWAKDRELGLVGLTMSPPTLEDVYLDLTQGQDDA